MNSTEQLQQIIENPEQDLLEFFTSLTEKEQQSLKSELKTHYLHLKTHEQLGEAKTKSGLKKFDQVKICAMHVYLLPEYLSNFHDIPRRYFDLRLYRTFAPEWLSEYLRKGHLRMHVTERFRYAMLADLEVMFDFPAPTDILAERLISVKTRQVLQYCEEFPVLLDRHIWLLFSEHAMLGFMRNEAEHWLKTFDALLKDAKIERMALLTHCVNALQYHRGDAEQPTWTLALLNHLAPTIDELTTLQTQMIALLPLSHTITTRIARPDTRAQLTVLAHLQTLLDAKKLDVDALLQAHPNTMKQQHSAVLLNVLALYEEIINKSPDHKTAVLTCVLDMLSNDDMDIKKRAQQVIQQYGDSTVLKRMQEKTAGAAATLPEQFKQRVHDPDLDVLDFFLNLSVKEQKSLKDLIMPAYRSLKPAVAKEKDSIYGITKKQQLMICAMKVLSRWDYIDHFQSLPKAYFSKNIYTQFRPKWLQTVLNDEWDAGLTYADIAELPAYPDCVMQPRAIAHYLIETFTRWSRGDELLRRTEFFDIPACLDTHIWDIFAEQCRIDSNDSDYDGVWTQTFLELAESGRIPRDKLLKECLQAANRNLPQKQTGWCFRLFDTLEPSNAELVSLQSDLLLALNCTHSKPVNDALKKLKIIASEVSVSDFVSASVAPLSSTTKTVVTNTLAVFEQLAKAHQSEPQQLAELCQAITTALLFPDEKVQTRVAKFLVKYGKTADEALVANVGTYLPEVYSSVKTVLAPFVTSADDIEEMDTENDSVLEETTFAPLLKVRDDNAITVPDNFDDRVFFLAQAFENNEPWHFDVYLQVMTDIAWELSNDNIDRLAPVLKNSTKGNPILGNHFKLNLKNWLSHYGNATFNLEIAQKQYTGFKSYGVNLPTRDTVHIPSQRVWIALMTHATAVITESLPVPMLSTPTHAPCFIDFNTLVARLAQYQAHNLEVDKVDFQIALSRVIWDEDSKVSGLDGELTELMTYLLHDTPPSAYDTPDFWFMAMHRKGCELKDFIATHNLDIPQLVNPSTWVFDNTAKIIDFGNGETHTVQEPQLNVQLDPPVTNIYPIRSDVPCYLAYFAQDLQKKRWAHDYHDILAIQYLLLTTPHNPSTLLTAVIYNQANQQDNEVAITEKTAIQTLSVLIETWRRDYPEFCYLYLACGMLHSKKTVVQIAGELWLKAVTENNIDSAMLGRILGNLQGKGYAPMKRFTDLIAAQLISVSTQHNQALITVITAMIAEMHDTPIKGVKKLLELYLELLTVTETPLPTAVKAKLTTWAEVKNLKPIIRKLMA